MGLSMITVLTIANRNDLIIEHSGPDCGGKYAGWICMPRGRLLLSSQQDFDSAEAAEQFMRDLRDICIEWLTTTQQGEKHVVEMEAV